MIIDDLDAFRCTFEPLEADPPLVINPDAVLPLPVAAQNLQPVSGDGSEVFKLLGVIQHTKFPLRDPCNIPERHALLPEIELLGLLATEGAYHTDSIPRPTLNETRAIQAVRSAHLHRNEQHRILFRHVHHMRISRAHPRVGVPEQFLYRPKVASVGVSQSGRRVP